MSTSTTYILGTSPCNWTTEKNQPPAKEDTNEDNVDPDKLLQCPFDKNHQIRSCRFPYHLIKCRKNHPKLARELKTCPFNARHLIPKHEMAHHSATCVDRASFISDGWTNTEGQRKWHVPVSTWTNPSTEDWDKAKEDTNEDNIDPDKLLQCPFDKNHQIRSCRFPYHLIKCRKNHPKLARELKACPFNARHLIPKHEMAHHSATCVDRASFISDGWTNTEGQRKWHVPVNTWTHPSTDEDWDKEADDSAPPFVWGRPSTSFLRPEVNMSFTHKDKLNADLRMGCMGDITYLRTSCKKDTFLNPARVHLSGFFHFHAFDNFYISPRPHLERRKP